jgi:hypothetical protein
MRRRARRRARLSAQGVWLAPWPAPRTEPTQMTREPSPPTLGEARHGQAKPGWTKRGQARPARPGFQAKPGQPRPSPGQAKPRRPGWAGPTRWPWRQLGPRRGAPSRRRRARRRARLSAQGVWLAPWPAPRPGPTKMTREPSPPTLGEAKQGQAEPGWTKRGQARPARPSLARPGQSQAWPAFVPKLLV